MLFRRSSAALPAPEPDLDAELAQIEEQARNGRLQERASLLNRAGDLCSRGARERLAIAYYGRAIDCYVEAGCYGAAAALCRKLIRHAPQVVRAHCTLALLALIDRQAGDAALEISRYQQAARRTQTERLAIPRLRMMLEATDEPRLREAIAEALAALGDEEGAARARTQPKGLLLPGERITQLARVATLDADELWGRLWMEQSAPTKPRRAAPSRPLPPDPAAAAEPDAPRVTRGDPWGGGR